jgi:hypothetical protein
MADCLSIGSAKGALQLAHLTKSISKMIMAKNRVATPVKKANKAIVILLFISNISCGYSNNAWFILLLNYNWILSQMR